jgi:hypothetical protein
MKKQLQLLLIIDCMSYSCLVAIYSVLAMFDVVWPVHPALLLQFFLATSIIAAIQVLLARFYSATRRFSFVAVLLQMLGVLLPVFGLGGAVFRWFPVKVPVLLLVLAMCLGIYFAVSGIIHFNLYKAEKEINEAIRQRRPAKKGENYE